MNLIAWAVEHGGQRTVRAGLLGLRLRAYQGQGQPLQGAVEGLHVYSTRSKEAPAYHARSGVYGFLHLSPGIHRIHVEDPQRRYLPRALQVHLHDPANRIERLKHGQDTTEQPPVLDFALRPASGFPALQADAIVWGRVFSAANDAPLVFARLEIDGPERVVGYTDPAGNYLLRLSAERSEVIAGPAVQRTFPRTLQVHRLLQEPPAGRPPLLGFPLEFDRMEIGNAAFSGAYNPAAQVVPVTVEIGARTRAEVSF